MTEKPASAITAATRATALAAMTWLRPTGLSSASLSVPLRYSSAIRSAAITAMNRAMMSGWLPIIWSGNDWPFSSAAF